MEIFSRLETNGQRIKATKEAFDKENPSAFESSKFATAFVKNKEGKDTEALTRQVLSDDIEQLHKKLQSIRKGTYEINRQGDKLKPTFMGLNEIVKTLYGFKDATDYIENGLGISLGKSMESFVTSGDFNPSHRFLIPEIFLQEIYTGMQRPTIHQNLISDVQFMTQPTAVVPVEKTSDTPIKVMGEGDTYEFGTMEFDSKTVRTKTIGGAFRITDKTIREVPMNLYAKYVADFSRKLNRQIDAFALAVLMNGNASGESAPNIGVTTSGTLTYKDLARIWNRGDMIGRRYDTLVTTEDMALDAHLLPEFFGFDGGNEKGTFNFMSDVPKTFTPYKHAMIPANKILMVDKTAAMIKLIRENLYVETDRIANGRFNDTYISMSLGFAKMFRDATILLDKGTAFTSFPSYMDYAFLDTETFGGTLG